jgi:hypothetical protein
VSACRRVGVSANGRMGVWAYGRIGVWANGGEPLWILPERAGDICHGACKTGNCVKQAAPANVSTRIGLTAPQADEDL